MADTAAFIPFVAKAGRTAAQNRAEFIRFCREELKTFGPNLDFDSATWVTGGYFRRRGRPGAVSLHFTRLGDGNELAPPLPEPLATFAKAYVRYICSQKVRRATPDKEINAFRLLAQALSDKGLAIDIGLVDATLLDDAVTLAKARWGKHAVSGRGQKLSEIANFLRKKNLTDCIYQPWKHGLKGYRARSRIDEAAKAGRASKLPSKEATDALALAYHLAAEKRDIILTSVMALLFCAPERINEVFALPKNCEVEEVVDGKLAFGLRWAGSKQFPDHVKLIIDVFADVAKAAIERMRRHTEEARQIAAWYEANPGRLYLHTDCGHLRDQDLTLLDIQQITGMGHTTAGRNFLRRNGITCSGVKRTVSKSGPGYETNLYRFSEVERAIVALLPDGFPILDPRTNLRYSQAMMVTRRNEFGSHSSWKCMVSPITYMNIRHAFRHTPGGGPNIFERLGLSTKEHPISILSHQIRHFLNNLANHADVSQLDIAAWSGRVNVRQNRDYDHETAESIVERRRVMERQVAEVRASRGEVSHPINALPADPVVRRDVMLGEVQAHATEIGYCEHDFASSPCPIYLECLHCLENLCIKGHTDVGKVGHTLGLARQSLAKAENALSVTAYGADDWVKAQTETIARLEQLHGILIDPSIPDGTTIRLAKSGWYTLIEQALRDHETAIGEQPPSPLHNEGTPPQLTKDEDHA